MARRRASRRKRKRTNEKLLRRMDELLRYEASPEAIAARMRKLLNVPQPKTEAQETLWEALMADDMRPRIILRTPIKFTKGPNGLVAHYRW